MDHIDHELICDGCVCNRFLMDVGRSPFRTALKVSIVGHRSFGDIVMFKVVTEWRAWYSKTEKLYTDFNKLHNKLR